MAIENAYQDAEENWRPYTGSMKNVRIPDGARVVGRDIQNTFTSDEVRTVWMPNTVEVVEAKAFERCKNLESITLSRNLKILKGAAFMGCSKLRSVSLPKSLERMGNFAFSGTAVDEIRYAGTIEEFDRIEFGSGWSGDVNPVVRCTNGTIDFGVEPYFVRMLDFNGTKAEWNSRPANDWLKHRTAAVRCSDGYVYRSQEALAWFLRHWEKAVSDWTDGHPEPDEDLGAEDGLRTDLMPEPYWGNPADSSLVVAHLNPGTRGGRQANEDQSGKRNAKPPTPQHATAVRFMDRFVRAHGWDMLAKSFPLWLNDEEINDPRSKWADLAGYGGRHWWQRRKPWIEHFIADLGLPEKPPFAMELTGLHSATYGNREHAEAQAGSAFRYPGQALLAAVRASSGKLGLCFGKKWDEILSDPSVGLYRRGLFALSPTRFPNRRHVLFESEDGCRILVTWTSPNQKLPPPEEPIWSEEIKLLTTSVDAPSSREFAPRCETRPGGRRPCRGPWTRPPDEWP